MSNLKKKWNNCLTSIANFIRNHWIITMLSVKMSGIWFSLILAYGGEFFNLVKVVDGSKQLTKWGILSTIVIILLNVAITFIEKWFERNNQSLTTQVERDLFNTVLNRSSEASQSKLRQQLLELEKMQTGVQKDIPVIYSNPCQQISTILDHLSECICFLSSDKSNRFKKDDFQVSLMYNFVKENASVWKYANSPSTKSLDQSLITHPHSTATYLLDKQKSYVFFNSKEKAFKAKHYIADANDVRDEDGDLMGSILAVRFLFAVNSNTYIRAILCISTNNKKIVNEAPIRAQYKNPDDASTAVKIACDTLSSNMVDNIIKYFEYQIGSELCNYYIEFLRKNKLPETPDESESKKESKKTGVLQKILKSGETK